MAWMTFYATLTFCLLMTVSCLGSSPDDCLPARCQPVQEFCDINQGRCSLCSKLCYVGQGNEASCARNCPEYKKQYMDKPTTRSPLVSTQTEPSASSSDKSRKDGNHSDLGTNLAITIPLAVIGSIALISACMCRRRLWSWFSRLRDSPSSETLIPQQEQDAMASTSFHTGMRDTRLNGDGFVAAMMHYPTHFLRFLTGQRSPQALAVPTTEIV